MHLFISSALRIIPALVLSISPVLAGDAWETSFEKAKSTAVESKKDILIDFTGSDWCHWCVKLHEEVFEKDSFKAEAPKNFVLLELDFPQNKELPAELKQQNEELQKKFEVEGFPSVILTDASGRPYASSGYEEGGPETYLGILTKLRKIRESRDAAFEKAAKSEGVEKAKALAEGLKEIDPKFVHSFYAKEVELIVSLDKDDVTGLKAEQNAHKLEAEETAVLEGVGEKLQELQPKLEKLMEDKDVKGFETAMDEFIAENKLSGVGKQFIIIQKLAVYGPERIDEASKLLDTVIAIDPKSQIGRQAVEMKENIKEMKKSVDKSKTDGASKEEDGEPETEDKEAAEKEEKADSKKEKAE